MKCPFKGGNEWPPTRLAEQQAPERLRRYKNPSYVRDPTPHGCGVGEYETVPLPSGRLRLCLFLAKKHCTVTPRT